jgi:hypothetical protein
LRVVVVVHPTTLNSWNSAFTKARRTVQRTPNQIVRASVVVEMHLF